MSLEKIFVLDELVAKPGQGKALLQAYLGDYARLAKSHGMTLEFSWVSPAMWMPEDSNTLFIAWSVMGAPAWWGAVAGLRADPRSAAFWAKVVPMIERRSRRYPAAADALDRLADV